MRVVAVVGFAVSVLGCAGAVDNLQQKVESKVEAKVAEVDAKVRDQVRTAVTDACVKQVADDPRVRTVCGCVADELLAKKPAQEILAQLDRPLDLAQQYVEKCGSLILAPGADPAAPPAAPPGGAPPAPPAAAPQ